MALPLFSQIPTQVLTRIGKENFKKEQNLAKFYEDEIIEESDSEIDVEKNKDVVLIEPPEPADKNQDKGTKKVNKSDEKNQPNKKRVKYSDECPTSSSNQFVIEKTFSDASVQTDDLMLLRREAIVQTNETLLNRPISDYERHREQNGSHFADAYKPMYSIPKRQGKDVPPLKIGLTLRGRKRKVFYPGEEQE